MSTDLPDFLIVGAMKSGTTSLHEWLAEQPEVFMHPLKEPHFFSQEVQWNRGMDWYCEAFRGAAPGQLKGESSTSYTDPEEGYLDRASQRIAETLPNAKLIYVVRHPLDRLRSDLQHIIREGREVRDPSVALADVNAGYVARSCYLRCLSPYFDRFPRENILVVRFEDVVGGDHSGWDQVLAFLGLPPRPSPSTLHNATSDQVNAAWLKHWIRQRSWGPRVRKLPLPVRRAVKTLASRFQTELPEIPQPSTEVTQLIWADVSKFEVKLGSNHPLWER